MGPSSFILFSDHPSLEKREKINSIIRNRQDIEFEFIYPKDKFWEYGDDELNQIREKANFKVTGVLEMVCLQNTKEAHKILGDTALNVCGILSGLIDFNGAICPGLPKKMYEGRWLWEEANWSDIESYVREVVSKINGEIYTIEYKTANNRIWAQHICDYAFMASWIKHPMFHMIK